jgi:hypothetical protein
MNDSEHNSLIRNDYNTERDHREPNLIGDSLTLEDIKRKMDTKSDSSDDKIESVNAMINNLDNFRTTDTDMLVGLLANKETLVPEDDRILFEKLEHYSENSYEKDQYRQADSKDNIESHLSDELKDLFNDKNTGPVFDHGPSFGPKYSDKEPRKYSDGYRNQNQRDDNEFETKEEERLARLDILRKLGELSQHGVKLSQNYHMESDYKTMKYEYDLHKSIREKQNSVKWMSNMMLNICYGLELGNDKFDPFGFRLKGWSEQMNDDQTDYFDVLGELYEKYFKAGKPVPPELKLFFMITGSAIKFHLAHAMVNNIPNLGEMLKNNPLIADKLREQATSDKVREKNEKQREAFSSSINQQHDIARQKASDIQMLNERRSEFTRMQQPLNQYQDNTQPPRGDNREQNMMKQQLFQKELDIQNLQNQLNIARSDSRSMYTTTLSHQDDNQYSTNNKLQKTMKPPNIPNSLKNRSNIQLQPQFMQQMRHVDPIHRLDQQEFLRQQQIMEHKRHMTQHEIDNQTIDTPSYDGNPITNINPNIDAIIGSSVGDIYGNKISTISTIDADDVSGSNGSQLSLRRKRRKKNNIKINT